MNDSEFIELLNLYVDHEITADQATRLEAEVTNNPQRRKLYRQYCMMDKACALLADTFTETVETGARIEAGREPAASSRGFWSWSGGFYAAGLATAACLALVLVARMHNNASPVSAAATVAQAAPAAQMRMRAVPAAAPSDADLRVVMAIPQRSVSFPSPFGSAEFQTVLNTRAWGNPAAAPVSAAPSAAFAWMDDVRMAPIAHNAIDLPALNLPASPATIPVMAPGSADQVDMAAFQFTR